MRTATAKQTSKFVQTACARCGRLSAFIGPQDLCPSCRAGDIERKVGLRLGLLSDYALLPDGPAKQSLRRVMTGPSFSPRLRRAV
jgi:hypothetical protein